MSKHKSQNISVCARLCKFTINVYNFTHYNVFPVRVNYAKQSQCQVRQKYRKLFYDKHICKNGQLVIQTNKPKTNPIKAKTNPIQTQFKPKQTQFKANKAKNKANSNPTCSELVEPIASKAHKHTKFL